MFRIYQANVLDKNEECINLVQMVQEDGPETLSVKDHMLNQTHLVYTCGKCTKEHNLKEALFSNQRTTIWDGKTETVKLKDKEVQIPIYVPFMVPCGKNEFTMHATSTKESSQ